jgi:hypothetical protein
MNNLIIYTYNHCLIKIFYLRGTKKLPLADITYYRIKLDKKCTEQILVVS